MASTLLARSECLSERAAIASSRRGQGGKEEEVPERYEASITTLEITIDMSKISLTKTVATGQLFQMETVVAAADALLLSVAPHIPWMCLHQPCCNHKRLKQEKMVKFKRGWVPQVLILEHEAIGVFVTHCGWNSSLEAVNAGVPMITWPMGADQIFNEKLVTEVLKIGMPIGARKLFRLEGDSITCDAVEEAVKRIMIGEEAIEMRNRTKVPSQLAKQAMKGGGSSFTELEALVEELSSLNY
ncbi:UDP-glucose flavonoid 3-O-glucosyltransferase 7-like [Glycine max]|uniref:UDP-glucose flavonoid 3-O-glucosyltransferase 7-like n=1 Tax=Glycine max TaxID=3847 RepID=UPI0003DE78A4|nr:UDP-glucose flavonoid 3-O-glucosyltransferase 7-like [Glycine max]|eukprot:XP_006606622.1 UDP-glucose flavonoid 3-O-glucosyltransferase 7-like [Glycine max]